jgi:hypothetical protein
MLGLTVPPSVLSVTDEVIEQVGECCFCCGFNRSLQHCS